MAIEELLHVVAPPAQPAEGGDAEQWAEVERELGTPLPRDYFAFASLYGSGAFDDPGRLMVYVWNPFGAGYLKEVKDTCKELRRIRDLPEDHNVPYGVFPDRPGWVPFASDIDGSLLCWLTEGAPDDWPIILLSAERTSFQQLRLPLTTFLARAFTRQLPLILWDDPAFFAGPQPVRFVPDTATAGQQDGH